MVEDFKPNVYDVQINMLYFVSLAFALPVSSVCILGKQWIREYQKEITGSACDAVRIRQMRYDSLQTWKVPQIMATLPVILLGALLLFFTGLLIQLRNVDEHKTAVVALTVLFIIVTTVVPTYCSMKPRPTSFTPFRSPRAWIFFVDHRRFQRWYHELFQVYSEMPKRMSSWAASDLHFLKIEQHRWFSHDIISVHRVLKCQVFDVLRTSSDIEK